LNYTVFGNWSYVPTSGASYVGQMVSGYFTSGSGVPTTGSATYSGVGGAVGTYAVPSGANSIETGTLIGDLSLNVNFAGNTASGSITNMKAQAAGSNTTTQWNSLTLSGSLDRRSQTESVSLGGQVSTTTNSGSAGFSSAAKGTFAGMLFGPAAQEVGGSWSLSESTAAGGKAAFGVFGGKQ
jgi:hypothetical protein